jgi:uncharacterized protein GlcG (DUF336 family)
VFLRNAALRRRCVNGEIVGAIGVSSAQPDWDAAIAAAGAAILAAKH